jgi:tetratricopeptide (TPR) repeat protein
MKKTIIVFLLLVVVMAMGIGFFVWSDWGINVRRLWLLRFQIPDFHTAFVVRDPLLSPATAQQLLDQAAATVKQLDADWTSFDRWMQLAALRKVAGDLRGAAEAWEFASMLEPAIALPLHNLGNLYSYDLRDATKAEAYYLRALPLGENDILLYRSIYEFYRFIKKDDARARQYLQEGIDNNVLNAQDLEALLRSF